MGIFENFPYTNFHELNLNWILSTIKKLDSEIDEFVQTNVLTYADPIQWNITTQYAKNTVVVGPDGTAYMSVAPVPTNTLLTNTDYWQPIFNYAETVTVLKKQIAAIDMGDSKSAITSVPLGGLFWQINTLYRAKKDIAAGDGFVIGTNCELCTVEEAIKNIISPASDIGRSARNIIDSASGDYKETSNHKTVEAVQITEHTTANREVDVDGASSVHVDGTSTVNIGGEHTEVYAKTFGQRVTGKRTVNIDGGSEEVHSKPAKITAPDLVLDIENGITYKTPEKFNDFFDSVPMKDGAGSKYNVLTGSDTTKYILTGYKAESLGVIPDDDSEAVRANNKAIINTALSEGKTVLFGKKTYHIDCGLALKYKSGLVGEGTGSVLRMYGNDDGITVPIEYAPTTEHNVWSTVILTNLWIISANSNKTPGAGLRILNYTYDVTCEGDRNKYLQLKGDVYGLELRNSDISNLYITGFHSNVYLGGGCTLINMHHIISTDGIIGIEDHSDDSNISNIFVTFAQQFGIYMKRNMDARYSNVKIYQNGKSANSTIGYPGLYLEELWSCQFSNVTAEENAGIGIYMVRCKGVTINAIASSNGFAPLSTTDIYSYAGLSLTDCEGIVGTIQAIDKHGWIPEQPPTQSFGFTSNKAGAANLLYYEIGNKKTINESSWESIQCLQPVNNTLDFDCLPAGNITINYMKSRYHNNRLEIYGNITTTANIPAGNWLLNLSGITYNKLTANVKTYDTTYATAISTSGVPYPLTIIPNQSVAVNTEIPANTILFIGISVPITV